MARTARAVYGVHPVEDTHTGTAYFTNKVAAMRQAHAVANGGTEATVTKDIVIAGGDSDLFCRLLNHEGWSAGSEVVAVIPAKPVTI